MEIYRLCSSNGIYKTIAYADSPLMSIIGEEDWGDLTDIENYSYHWEVSDKDICDAPFLIGAIPIFRSEVVSRMGNSFPASLVMQVPIKVEGEDYTILKARSYVSNILNEKKSKLSRFSDGRIMDVEKYVFKPIDNVPSFFKILQYPLFTFVAEDMAEILMKASITGLALEECRVKKTWFL